MNKLIVISILAAFIALVSAPPILATSNDRKDLTHVHNLAKVFDYAVENDDTDLLARVDDALVEWLESEMREKQNELAVANEQVAESEDALTTFETREERIIKNFALLDDKLDMNAKIDESLEIQDVINRYRTLAGETDAESIEAKSMLLDELIDIQRSEIKRNKYEKLEHKLYSSQSN